MEFSAAADELYAVPPAEFVATRRRLAADVSPEEARRLTAMRRPTVSAWAVNMLVRDGGVGELLDLGERMREAWSSGGDVGGLERERTSVIDRLVARARDLAEDAGRPLSEAFAGEVEDTLRAAVADPSAADAVRVGRLEHPLRYAGFGVFGEVSTGPRPPAGTTRAPGRPRASAGSRTSPGSRAATERSAEARRERARREEEERREEERQEEERRREEAARLAEEADRSLAEWTAELETAQGRLAEADKRLADLQARLREAEGERADLDRRARLAKREHDRAARAAKEARRRADEPPRGGRKGH